MGADGNVAGERLPEFFLELGIVGFPESVADMDPGEVEVTVLEAKTFALDLINATALFGVGVAAGVEDDAVAGLEGNERRNLDEVGTNVGDGAEVGSPFFSEPGVDEILMVDAVQPAGKKSARECHLELIPIFPGDWSWLFRRENGVDGFSINLSDGGDVFRGFQAAFNFKTGDAESHEIGDFLNGGEILRGEEVTAIAQVAERSVNDQAIGKAAGLRALAAIGAPLSQGFARETLSGIRHAEGSVDKGFEGEHVFLLELGEIAEREFASDHRAGHAEAFGEVESFRGSQAHLRGGMNLESGNQRAGQRGQADVLNNGGIDSGRGGEGEKAGGFREFAGEDQRIHHEIAFAAAVVEVAHEFREIGFGEIIGPHPGVEGGETEVDSVGSVRDGGFGAVPVASGGEEFGAISGGRVHEVGGKS